MTRVDLHLWIETYAAMGLMCAIGAVLSALRVIWLYWTDPALHPRGWKGWLLAAPLLWLRWQKVYLTTAPVTLGIIVLFGSSLPWSQNQGARPSHATPAARHAPAPSRN